MNDATTALPVNQPAVTGEKKIYRGMDVLKLICAFLILFMHTYCFDFNPAGNIIKAIANIGVPFFFIASGFFFGKGIERAADKKKYFTRYFLRLFWMYCIWTVLTLPASIYNITTIKELSIPMLLLRIVRSFFLSGSMGVYWYLLSMLCVSILLYFVQLHPKLRLPLFIVSILLYIVGIFYQAGYLEENIIGTAIHVLFGSERNFLTVGLFFMCIGYGLSHKSLTLPPMWVLLILLGVSVGLIVADYYLLPIDFAHAIASFVLFLVGLKWDCRISDKAAARCRRFSTGLYLLHFPFIIVFDLYLQNGTWIDLPVTLAFAVVVFSLGQLLPEKIRSLVFG